MILESFRIAFRAIWAHKMRSFLTTLGIIIGVAAVVAVVSIVQGFFQVIQKQFEGLEANTLFIEPNRPPGHAGRALGRIRLTWEDGQAIARAIDTVDEVVPAAQRMAYIKHGDNVDLTFVFGTTAEFQDVRHFYVERGRFITPIDVRRRAKVCAIGKEMIKKLDLKGEPIGQKIKIQDQDYTIVGVMEERGELLGFSMDEFVLIPLSSAVSIWGRPVEEQVTLMVKTTSPSVVDRTADQITFFLRKRHGLKGDDPDDFNVISQAQVADVLGTIVGYTTSVLAGIVSISLVVGGIGIMNILLVSVTERMREIGLRMAVGAPRRMILVQFMIEAVSISLVGGVIGIGVGAAVGFIAAQLIPNWPGAYIPLWAIALAFGFSSLVGAVFGIYPAYRASRLDPIESLRYE